MNFQAVVDAIKDKDFDTALEMASVKTYLNTISKGRVSVNESGRYLQRRPAYWLPCQQAAPVL